MTGPKPFLSATYLPAPRTAPEPHHLAWADLLHAAVVRETGRGVRWSKKDWANQFRLLEEDRPGSRPEIDKVLNYYCTHLDPGDRRQPIGHAGRSFRAKYDGIKRWVEIHVKDNPDVKITPEAERVVDDLTRFRWPKGAAGKLPAAVQQSLNNLEDFTRRLEAAEPRLPRRAAESVWTLIGARRTYVRRWFERVWNRVRNSPNWNGEFRWYVWHPGHEWVTADGRGATKDWDRLVKEVAGEG